MTSTALEAAGGPACQLPANTPALKTTLTKMHIVTAQMFSLFLYLAEGCFSFCKSASQDSLHHGMLF